MDPKVVDELVARYSMSEADRALLSTMFVAPHGVGDSPTITAAVTLDSGLRAATDPEGRPEEPGATPPSTSARYEDRGVIGTGGMGEVRRVFDRSLNRTMAMKIIRPERLADTLTRMRFIEEAQANAQLQHPGIVPVHEIGRLDDGRLYFTMKEVRGRTMAALIAEVHAASATEWRRSETGWTFRRLVSAFQQICRTVAFAHSRGIVHRDLKPKNVMLGEFGEAMVLDWGLAKPVGLALDLSKEGPAVDTGRTVDTCDGAVAGTPAFMSPEQAAGRSDLDPRSDIYSLGAILYAILSDRPPYQGTSAAEVVRMVLGQAPKPSGRDGGPEVPQELVELCAWAMARDSAARPATAVLLADEVTSWLDGLRARERALELVAQADAHGAEAETLRNRATDLEGQAAEHLRAVASWQTEELKAPGWALADEAEALRISADVRDLQVQQSLQEALHQDPSLDEAHARLADFHLRGHQQAEIRRDEREAAQRLVLVRRHHRGRHRAYLAGEGLLTLHTDPPGAEVQLHRFEVHNRRMVPRLVRSLGTTPLAEVRLPIGSYLAVITAEGRRPVRYPVRIERQGHWDGVPPGQSAPHQIELPTVGTDDDAVYVPAGWMTAGGDPAAYGGLPRRRLWVDGLMMHRFPVTLAQYVVFLQDLMASGRTADALAALPRSSGTGEPTGVRVVDGTVQRVTDRRGWWLPDWPVFNVDWRCASAYARWWAARTDQPWRLPGELEWEKAARGVDGRFYPWGDHLDPSWCRITDTHHGPRTPAPVDSHAVDVSPYGARGMGGNVGDWCVEAFRPEGPECPDDRVPRNPDPGDPQAAVLRVVRGGSWDYLSARRARSAGRDRRVADFRFSLFGFRLARPIDPEA